MIRYAAAQIADQAPKAGPPSGIAIGGCEQVEAATAYVVELSCAADRPGERRAKQAALRAFVPEAFDVDGVQIELGDRVFPKGRTHGIVVAERKYTRSYTGE